MSQISPTVEELNEAQAEWMKLDPAASEKETRRVFALMNRYPHAYVSGHDGIGVCMLDGMPLSRNIPFTDALKMCAKHGGRTDVAWHGGIGKWVRL